MKSNKQISLSLKSQIKMALHATKYGYSTPIHGIVLGKSSNSDDDGSSLEVLDVVPVCHEVPTKPIVDMALRLTDAYLQQQQQELDRVIEKLRFGLSFLDNIFFTLKKTTEHPTIHTQGASHMV